MSKFLVLLPPELLDVVLGRRAYLLSKVSGIRINEFRP